MQKAQLLPARSILYVVVTAEIANDPKLFQGDVSRLKEMRLFIENHLVSTYRSGQEAAAQRWDGIPFHERNALVSIDVADFRTEAQTKASEALSPSLKQWFVDRARAKSETQYFATLAS